jgi:hypothetical protein
MMRGFDLARGTIWWIGAGTAISFWFLILAHWWRKNFIKKSNGTPFNK